MRPLLLPYPRVDPVFVRLGPIAIRWYALAYIAGFLLGWRYGVGLSRDRRIWRGLKPTLDIPLIDDLILWIIIAILVGGRLGSVFFYNTSIIWTDPAEILAIWHGGMSFHGALIAVVIALALFSWRRGVDLLRVADMTAPCVPFGLFFGRLANFINGELWGRPTNVPWAMVFPAAGPEPRHPSQLYEAGLEGVLLFVILRIATHGAKLLPRRGAVTGLFLVFYAVFRISLENVREPDRGMPDFPLGLTMGMILSLPMLAAGLGLLVFALTRPPGEAAVLETAPGADELDGAAGAAARAAAPQDVPELSSDVSVPPMEDPLAARTPTRE